MVSFVILQTSRTCVFLAAVNTTDGYYAICVGNFGGRVGTSLANVK